MTFGTVAAAVAEPSFEMVTVYAELLRLALAERDEAERSVGELVSDALVQHENLDLSGPAADRLAAELAYDRSLVRLCDRLGIAHDLLGPCARKPARRKTERAVAAALADRGGVDVPGRSVTTLLDRPARDPG